MRFGPNKAAGGQRSFVPRALALALTLALVLAACGDGNDADPVDDTTDDATDDTTDDDTTDDATDDATDDPEVEGETFTLTIGSALSPAILTSIEAIPTIFIPLAQERVAAETPHEIEFTELFGTVVGIGEELGGIAARQLEVGTSIFPYEPSELPLHNMSYFAPFGSNDIRITTQAYRAAYESSEEFQQTYLDNNQMPLAFVGVGDYGLVSVDAIDGRADLQGAQIAGVGSNLEWLSGTGATPIAAPATEWYTSFQTGVYDGGINFLDGVVSLSLYEVADYWYDMQFGSVPLGALNVNLDAFNELPADVQDVLMQVGLEFEQQTAQLLWDRGQEAYATMEAEGMTVVPGDDLREGWAEGLQEVVTARIEDLEAQGYPMSAVLEVYIQTQEDLGHEFPYRYDTSVG